MTLVQFLEHVSKVKDWDEVKTLCSDGWIKKGYPHQFKITRDELRQSSSFEKYNKDKAKKIHEDNIHLFNALFELCYALGSANTSRERKEYLHAANTRINHHLNVFTHHYHELRRDQELYLSNEDVRIGSRTQATNINTILGTIEKAGIITRELQTSLIEHAQEPYPTELRSFAIESLEELSTWVEHTGKAIIELRRDNIKII